MAKLPKVCGAGNDHSRFTLQFNNSSHYKQIYHWKKQNYSAAHWVMQSCALLLMNVTRWWDYEVTRSAFEVKKPNRSTEKKFNILEKINLFAFPMSEGQNRKTRNPFAWICLKSGGQTLHKVFEDPFSDSLPWILQQINLFLSVLNSFKGEVFFNIKPLLCISYRSSSPMHRSLTQRSYRL